MRWAILVAGLLVARLAHAQPLPDSCGLLDSRGDTVVGVGRIIATQGFTGTVTWHCRGDQGFPTGVGVIRYTGASTGQPCGFFDANGVLHQSMRWAETINPNGAISLGCTVPVGR